MKNLNSNQNLGSSYKQIGEQLDLAMTMFDEGKYSATEYQTIINELKNDFIKLEGKNNT